MLLLVAATLLVYLGPADGPRASRVTGAGHTTPFVASFVDVIGEELQKIAASISVRVAITDTGKCVSAKLHYQGARALSSQAVVLQVSLCRLPP